MHAMGCTNGYSETLGWNTTVAVYMKNNRKAATATAVGGDTGSLRRVIHVDLP